MVYVKKPIPVKIEPYSSGMEDGIENISITIHSDTSSIREVLIPDYFVGVWINKDGDTVQGYRIPYINTLEGKHYIRPDDYIVTGVDGERYPIKKSIFEATYEPYKKEAGE